MVGDPGEDALDHFKLSQSTYEDFICETGGVKLDIVVNRIRMDIQLVREWNFDVDIPVASRLGQLPPATLDKMVKSLVDFNYLSPVLMSLLNRSLQPLAQHKQLCETLDPIRQWVSDNPDTSNKENEEQDADGSVLLAGVAKAEKKVEAFVKPDAKKNTQSGRGIYTYCPRYLKRKGKDQICFVCEGITKGPLFNCEGKIGSKHCCSTRFHMACIKAYNAGDFDFEYLKEVTGKAQCPLHFCSVCFQERRKTSAINGKMIGCAHCFRSFHTECLPATVPIRREKIECATTDVLMEVIICHAHVDLTVKELVALQKKAFPVFTGAKGKRSHLPFCCECESEGDKKKLVGCTNCIRSFHPECHAFSHYISKGVSHPGQTLCEGCLYGEFVRAGQKCIARYQNSFFPCKAVAFDTYPSHCATVDKYGAFLGRPGFIAVEWAGCQNLFSMQPPGTVVPMFSGSFDLIGKRMSDSDHNNAWRMMEKDCEPPKPVLPCNDNYTPIRASIPFGDCKNLKIAEVLVGEDEASCSCKDGEANRCGPGSGCTNRALSQECPKVCEGKDGGCGNRTISNKVSNPNIERREAVGKGYGVYAVALIREESVLAEYAGELLTVDEKNRRIDLSKKSRNNEEMHYMMGLDNLRTIDCKLKGNIARFFNHSCEPNCKVVVMNIITGSKQVQGELHYKVDVRVGVQAIRDIKPGEELCFNYRMDKLGDGVDLPVCLCNTPSCSGQLSNKQKEARKHKKEVAVEEMEQVDGGASKKGTPLSTPKANSRPSKRTTSEKKAQQPKENTPVVKKEEGEVQSVRRRGRGLTYDHSVSVPVHVAKGKALAIPFKSEVRDEDEGTGKQFFSSANKKSVPASVAVPKVEVKDEEELQLQSPDFKRRKVAFDDNVQVLNDLEEKEEPSDEDDDGGAVEAR